MYDMLKARPEVTELAAVPDAYVPVIKMQFSGIPVRKSTSLIKEKLTIIYCRLILFVLD